MRCFSILPQISGSRPRALIEYSLVMLARSFKWRSKANAAASNAGPRFAEVAGRLIAKALGLLGLSAGHGGLGLLGLFEHTNHGVSIGIEHNRSPLPGGKNFGLLGVRRAFKQITTMKFEREVGILEQVSGKHQHHGDSFCFHESLLH